MSPHQTLKPYWTVAWTRWGTRCSALVSGGKILKVLDGFTHIDRDDVVELMHVPQQHAG